MGKLPEIPDLDVPSGRPSRAPASTPATSARPRIDEDALGGGIEHGIAQGPSMAPPGSHRGKALSVDFGVRGDDDFGESIEHGAGAMPIASASRPPVSKAPSSLELSYNRLSASRAPRGPSKAEVVGARVVPAVAFAAAFAALFKLTHHAGAYAVGKLLPHALDASSTTASGILAGALFIAAFAVGFVGLRPRRRSYAMVLAGGALLVASLAMVTVTLVSTDEAPQPPDGARLIPYVVPAALVLLGIGVAGRGVWPFFDRGARRVLSVVLGLLGGAIAFAGLALSIW